MTAPNPTALGIRIAARLDLDDSAIDCLHCDQGKVVLRVRYEGADHAVTITPHEPETKVEAEQKPAIPADNRPSGTCVGAGPAQFLDQQTCAPIEPRVAPERVEKTASDDLEALLIQYLGASTDGAKAVAEAIRETAKDAVGVIRVERD